MSSASELSGFRAPRASTQYKTSDFYSKENPVPSIQRFFNKALSEVLANNGSRSDDESEETDANVVTEEEQDESGQDTPTQNGEVKRKKKKRLSEVFRRGGKPSAKRREHVVHDPITDSEITIHNVGRKEFDRRIKQDKDANAAARAGLKPKDALDNVLTRTFPPVESLPTRLDRIHPFLVPLWIAWSAALLVILRKPAGVALVVINAWLAWLAWKKLRAGAEDRRWAQEAARAESVRRGELHAGSTTGDGIRESVEWANQLVASLWSILDDALFASMGGTLEDVMSASIPSFIHAVKVAECAQGATPVRITGLKILSDREAGHAATRPEETNNQGGAYVNLEISIVYRAKPTSSSLSLRGSSNAHLLVHFFLGLKKWISFPLPVFVEIKGFVGTVRLRVQLVPDAPFIGNCTFSFAGLPRGAVEVTPLSINLSNVPFLSGFIQSSIDAAIGEYVAPASLTMDIGELIAGDQIKREVDALGVIVVHFHRAYDLEAADRTGSSDPYCTVGFSKLHKVGYATRVARNDLDVRWEERHVMLLTSEALRAREKVSVGLWDSDRLTPYDLLGRVEIEVTELYSSPGKMMRKKSELMGLNNQMKKEGTIEWSVGFFRKTSNTVRQDSNEDRHNDKNSDKEDGHSTEEVHAGKPKIGEEAVRFRPPSAALPSGILSIQVHNAVGLEAVNTRQSLRKRAPYEPARDVEQVEDERDQESSPSSYFSIVLNEQTVFRSRTKALSGNPFFQAGTERFIRDWRRTQIMIVLRDQRLREADPILGVVPINLAELFKTNNSSQVTQFFPIGGGVGRGQLRISLLFRPVHGLSTQKAKLGFDIGTCQIHAAPKAHSFVDDSRARDLQHTSLKVGTLAANVRVHSRKATWDADAGVVEWKVEDRLMPLRIPARRRYATPLAIEFRKVQAPGIKKVVAMAIVWLQDVPDDEIIELELPIWQAEHDFHRLRQNYSDYRDEEQGKDLGCTKVGTLSLKLRFKSGVGKTHLRFGHDKDAADVLEAWRACTASGLRSIEGDFVTPDGEASEAEQVSGSDSEEEERTLDRNTKHQRTTSSSSRDIKHNCSGDDEIHEGNGKPSLKEKLRKWKEERDELGRQHKGSKQFKVVRTASLLSKSAHDRAVGAASSLKVDDRRTQQVESEL